MKYLIVFVISGHRDWQDNWAALLFWKFPVFLPFLCEVTQLNTLSETPERPPACKQLMKEMPTSWQIIQYVYLIKVLHLWYWTKDFVHYHEEKLVMLCLPYCVCVFKLLGIRLDFIDHFDLIDQTTLG